MYNEALQVVIEIQNKTEDQIKSKECSKKAKLQKDQQKAQRTLFDCF